MHWSTGIAAAVCGKEADTEGQCEGAAVKTAVTGSADE